MVYETARKLAQAKANQTGENQYLIQDAIGQWFAADSVEIQSGEWDATLVKQSRTVYPEKQAGAKA